MSEHGTSSPRSAWRPLTIQERTLLQALTDQDFPGSDELRQQIAFAEARKGCECGCGTIELAVDRADVAPAPITHQPVPGEAEVLGVSGESIGGLILWARDGYLSSLEVYTWVDPFGPLPDPDLIRTYVR
jgi:hypothetical protein